MATAYAFRSPSNHRSTSARRQPTAREPWPPSLTGAGKSPARTRRHNDVRDRPINVSTDGVRRIAGKKFPAVPDGPVERSCLDIEVSLILPRLRNLQQRQSIRWCLTCQPSIWLGWPPILGERLWQGQTVGNAAAQVEASGHGGRTSQSSHERIPESSPAACRGRRGTPRSDAGAERPPLMPCWRVASDAQPRGHPRRRLAPCRALGAGGVKVRGAERRRTGRLPRAAAFAARRGIERRGSLSVWQ